jgi:arsenical resistance protein ArsH
MAYKEFDDRGRMKPSSYYGRIVDLMGELVRFTVLLCPHAAQLVDRYSERKQADIIVDPILAYPATVPFCKECAPKMIRLFAGQVMVG